MLPQTLSPTVANPVKLSQGINKLYTIVLYLAGQQASGVQALLCLQCSAKSLGLPLTILEPVIPSTEFKAMPPLQHYEAESPQLDAVVHDSVVKFSDLFDLDHFNEVSSSMHYAQLTTRDVFFKTAPRNIVFVNIHEGKKGQNPTLSQLWPVNDTYDGCFDPMVSNDLTDDVKSQLHQIDRKGFCIVKVIDYRFPFRKKTLFSKSQLTKSILGEYSYSEIILTFNVWRAMFRIMGPNTKTCAGAGYKSSKGQIRPSKQLMNNVLHYEELFLNASSSQVALMVRLEHVHVFVGKDKRKQWTIKKCLNAALKKTQELKPQTNPFVTLDIGKFGSMVMKSSEHQTSDTELINEFMTSLYDGQWSISEWEESFTQASGGNEDSSYIAALQRTLASRAECLILVGGGMFQELTMKKYMSTHEKANWCIHLYCIKDRSNYAI